MLVSASSQRRAGAGGLRLQPGRHTPGRHPRSHPAEEYAYDLDKNLAGLTVHSGDALLARNSYAYDGNGNRTLKRQLGGETLYHYDPLNQVKKVEYPGYTEELFYDKVGNRTHIKTSGGAAQELEYDTRGNIVGVVDGNRNSTKEN